jgi:lipopolysaccharide/colanic/teichoic acid biosynthesis glycosyltransferase
VRDFSRELYPSPARAATRSAAATTWPAAVRPAPVHREAAHAVAPWKRLLDIFCILLTLPVTLPVVAVVALWIKLASRGPAIFRQQRIGLGGRRFTLYKFRSMHCGADTRRHTNHFAQLVNSDRPMVKLDLLEDSRLIPGGCLLRAAALDELPQLFNVLRGEMSLVGPRPCLPEEFGFFSHPQRVRFEALPGMTGLWQVQGKEWCTFSEMNQLDADYVRHSSPLMDLRIILRTPLAVLRQMRHACRRHRGTRRARKSQQAGSSAAPDCHARKTS